MRQENTAHVLPVKTYLAVYVGLVVLTSITVGVSLLELGTIAIYVAMGVALVKASLVVGYFMHLKFDARFNSLVFFSALLFLAIFFSLTMVDLGTRGSVQEEQGNFVLSDEREAARRSLERRRPAAATPRRASDAAGGAKAAPASPSR